MLLHHQSFLSWLVQNYFSNIGQKIYQLLHLIDLVKVNRRKDFYPLHYGFARRDCLLQFQHLPIIFCRSNQAQHAWLFPGRWTVPIHCEYHQIHIFGHLPNQHVRGGGVSHFGFHHPQEKRTFFLSSFPNLYFGQECPPVHQEFCRV